MKSRRHDIVRRPMWVNNDDHEMLLIMPVVWDTYMYFLHHYAVFTQSITAAFFAGMGDVCAQFLSVSQSRQVQQQEPAEPARTSSSSYDVQRTMHYVFKGLGGGCMWSVWFSNSDPISLDLTQRLLELLYNVFLQPGPTELGSAMVSGDIDVATAVSHLLFTSVPVIAMSGCTLQHIIHVALCILLEQFLVSPLFYSVWDIPIPALLSGSPIRQIPAQIQAKLVPLLIANAKVWTPANIITYSLPSEYRVLFASMTDVIWQTILSDITSNEITLAPPPPPIPKTPPLSSLTEIDSAGVVATTVEPGSRTTVAPTNSNAVISDNSRVVTTVSVSLSPVGTTSSMNAATTVFQSNAAVTTTTNGPE